MTKDQKTKFGFQIGDDFHSILSVRENKIGELNIAPAFAENYTEIEFGNIHADKKISEQHYSVHNSPQFEDENVLNHTLEYIDGTKTNTRIYTRAFKRTNLSCPIFLARGQDFSIDRYRAQKKDNYNYISLGGYDSKKATLYYMVVIGNSGVKFNDDYPDINIKTIHFQKYSITLMWSFGLVPSHSTGSKSHFLTLKDFETQWKEGFQTNEIINVYRHTRQFQHSSFLRFLQQQFKDKANDFKLLQGIGFKKTPELSINESDKKMVALNHGYECFNLGRKAQGDGFMDEALNLFDAGAKIFKEQEQAIAYADVLNSKGGLFQVTGFPAKAVKCYEESLDIYKKFNLDFHIVSTYLCLSIVHRDSGDSNAAIKLATEALIISNKEGFTSLQADLNRELGVLHKNLKLLSKATEFLNVSLKKYRDSHNMSGEGFCLGNLGLIQAIEGKYTQSLNLHEQALNIFSSINNKWGIANEKANVGNMNCILGNFELGLTQLNSALEGHQQTGYQYGIATDLKLLGVNFLNSGESAKGKLHLEQSKDLLQKIGNNHEANQISQILKQFNL